MYSLNGTSESDESLESVKPGTGGWLLTLSSLISFSRLSSEFLFLRCLILSRKEGIVMRSDAAADSGATSAGDSALQGIYHLAAGGETTWHTYAQHVVAEALRLQPTLQIKAQEIAAVPTSAFPTPAARPHNSRLDTRKLQEAFGLVLPPWQQGVDRMLAEVLGGR
ncbi:MAG: hypothetical protein EOO77_28510 [Oxalobacteraceae bacterium]|nr:MAG: hypothetical protein EOO77_28510 [Oxalobacteraceae bacterium]